MFHFNFSHHLDNHRYPMCSSSSSMTIVEHQSNTFDIFAVCVALWVHVILSILHHRSVLDCEIVWRIFFLKKKEIFSFAWIMNWGSIPIKLEPWNSNGPLYSHYHFATYENEYVTGDGPSSNELDTNHQRTNERANERVTMKKNEDDLVKNNKKDTKYKRYHPYKEKKCFKENAGQSIARNRIEKGKSV